ncbi:MAG: glycosyltransferase, partial [Planctomycetaceae bacterium]
METADETRPTVVVYTHSLLEPSMTFILSHAEALGRYRAVYAGARRVNGLTLPPGRSFTANRGGAAGLAEEFLFRQFGRTGRFAADLRECRPRLVHAHFGLSGPAARTLAIALGVPLVITYHGRDATIADKVVRKSRLGREFIRGRKAAVSYASLIIAVSDFIRKRLLARGCPDAKIVVHRNGIDTRFFRRDGQEREGIALFVGRFVEKKGCEYLLRALGKLRAEGCPARGVLIGDGPLKPRLLQIAAEAGADVAFTGFLPLDQVKDWLGRASVVAVPSVTAADGDCEGLPTVILEAQAMGTPVVATRHSGIPEGVIENRSALLVAERDVGALAEALRIFMEKPEAVSSFGAAGRAFVEANFDIVAQARGLEDLYDRARQGARSTDDT